MYLGMVDFLKSLGEVVVGVVAYLLSIIEDIVQITVWLGSVALQLPIVFASWLPETLITVLIAVFGVVVIYKVVGRS